MYNYNCSGTGPGKRLARCGSVLILAYLLLATSHLNAIFEAMIRQQVQYWQLLSSHSFSQESESDPFQRTRNWEAEFATLWPMIALISNSDCFNFEFSTLPALTFRVCFSTVGSAQNHLHTYRST